MKLRPATTGVWWGPGASAGNACLGHWGWRGRPSSARATWIPWAFRILTMLYLGFPLSPFFKINVAEYIYDIKFATLTIFDDSVVLIHSIRRPEHLFLEHFQPPNRNPTLSKHFLPIPCPGPPAPLICLSL